MIPKIALERNGVRINGRLHHAVRSKNTPISVYYRGAYFETQEELWIAKMLRKMNIRFVHHVMFEVRLPDRQQPKLWCPDFILERPFVWQDYVDTGAVIAGIEAKKKKKMGGPQILSDAVTEQFGLKIQIVNRKMLEQWYQARILPLEELSAHGLSL